MMPGMSEAVQRYVAFSDSPSGGNPAGVVLEATGMSEERMLAIAAELGYSETAFLSGTDIRYFSPVAEVPFCGHATIATAVALAERDGPGDVLLALDQRPVRTVAEFRLRIASAVAGHDMRIDVERRGSPLQVVATLEEARDIR